MDKDKLLKPRLAENTYEIEGLGVFRFRSLSRAEVLTLRKSFAEDDAVITERKLLSAVLLDPVLTEDEIRQWQENSPPNEMEPLVSEVLKVSGMVGDTEIKEKMQQFPGEQ